MVVLSDDSAGRCGGPIWSALQLGAADALA